MEKYQARWYIKSPLTSGIIFFYQRGTSIGNELKEEQMLGLLRDAVCNEGLVIINNRSMRSSIFLFLKG